MPWSPQKVMIVTYRGWLSSMVLCCAPAIPDIIGSGYGEVRLVADPGPQL